jgi:hypothetical protein
MTIVEICNMALGFLGEDAVTTLADATKRAQLANANYAAVRDAILEERDWQFASTWTAIAADATAPTDPAYAARLAKPAGTLSVRQVVDSGGSPIEWRLAGAYVDIEAVAEVTLGGVTVDGALMRATASVSDTSLWPNNFSLAFAHRLAAVLAVPLSENRQLQTDQWQLYERALDKAASADSMQGRPFQGPRISTLKSARNS